MQPILYILDTSQPAARACAHRCYLVMATIIYRYVRPVERKSISSPRVDLLKLTFTLAFPFPRQTPTKLLSNDDLLVCGTVDQNNSDKTTLPTFITKRSNLSADQSCSGPNFHAPGYLIALLMKQDTAKSYFHARPTLARLR
ncbi:hypothetical protein MRB53_040793 [Persea americana]|nr:hypothetical protein MRB53_040793 [Persea americana]